RRRWRAGDAIASGAPHSPGPGLEPAGSSVPSELRPFPDSTLVPALFLAFIVVIAFWPVVSGQRSFFHLDLRYEHLPVWSVTQTALREGVSPFWIDAEYCGHPLLFHSEAPIFYPITAPLLWTGASVGRLADIFSLLHFWLAGFAAFLLLRDLGTDRLSALWGG